MSTVSTHVLDTARGAPAPGLALTLASRQDRGWNVIASARTDGDGRVADIAGGELDRGVYRLEFATDEYLTEHHSGGFYPEVSIVFSIAEDDGHYHVPLLLSPFGYSTYRGS